MRYTGIQPQYFPRLHYFARILNADIFVVRDDVQFVRKHKYPDGRTDKSFQVHTPIKQSFGTYLLTVLTKHEGFTNLQQTQLSYDQDWVESHLKTIQLSYSKAANFQTLCPEIGNLLTYQYDNLVQLNTATIFWGILHLLGEPQVEPEQLTFEFIKRKRANQKIFRLKEIKFASESKSLSAGNNLTANEKIIALCKEIGANEDYCGGTGAAAYMDDKIFAENGIKITVQDWKCNEYPQLFTKQVGFIPNLSIIDLLMNADIKRAQNVILGND